MIVLIDTQVEPVSVQNLIKQVLKRLDAHSS